MNSKVSVIIPTYNRADLLPRAIESALSQTFGDFELIVVDDGSTDNTKQVVEEFQKKDERIKYIWQENSGAPARPKNTGIKNAKGEYIAFLDHDDEWLLEKLEKQLELFQNSKKSELGLVGCDALIFDGNKLQKYVTPRYQDRFVFDKLLEGNFIWSASSVLVKKEVFQNIGLHDEKLKMVDDWDLWIRIAQKYSFDFVPEFLLKYYIHAMSVTSTISIKTRHTDLMHILEKHKKYYLSHPQVYSGWLRHMGTMYVLDRDLKRGREFFKKSIKVNPLNFKSYFYFLISLGGRDFYYWLTQIKMRLRRCAMFRKFDL